MLKSHCVWRGLALLLSLIAPLATANRYERIERFETAMNAAGPEGATHPALIDFIFTAGPPIHYRFQVEPGQAYVVVTGYNETYASKVGQRVFALAVEGAPERPVDAVREAGFNKPLLVASQGRDDGNGWLNVSLHPPAKGGAGAPFLAALWIFDRATWDGQNLTTATVLSGKADALGLYFIDGGKAGSSVVEHSLSEPLKGAGDALDGLRQLAAAEPALGAPLAGERSALETEYAALCQLQKELNLRALTPRLKAFSERLAKLRQQIEPALQARYAPQFTKAAETRMFSPWGGLVQLRQEDHLRMLIELFPRAQTSVYTDHDRTKRTEVMGYLDITTTAPVERLSTALGLTYNLGLSNFSYDPLATTYRYGDGTVTVRVLEQAAFNVRAERLPLTVQFDPAKVRREGDLWRGQMKAGGAPIHYALVFAPGSRVNEGAEPSVTCTEFNFAWADTPGQLTTLTTQLRTGAGSPALARDWGRQWSDQRLNIEAHAPLPATVELNQRAVLGQQFKGGAMMAALDATYLNTWVRDSTNGVVFAALAGDNRALRNWSPYLLQNPTPITWQGKQYTDYYTFPGPEPGCYKYELDGLFYATLTAFADWKLSGDASLLGRWYKTLDSGMALHRARYFDKELQLYYELQINEASLKAAREWQEGERLPALKAPGYDDWPLYNCGLYINNLHYGAHLMLAEMAGKLGQPTEQARHLKLAAELAANINKHLWDQQAGCYLVGLGKMEQGGWARLDWNYWDSYFDYVWAVSLFPMQPDAQKSLASLDAMLHRRDGFFPGPDSRNYAAFGRAHAAYVYAQAGQYLKAIHLTRGLTDAFQRTEWHDEKQAIYAMPGSAIECMQILGFHRPELFALGPWLHAVGSLGLNLDYNGVTLVPSGQYQAMRKVAFQGALLTADLNCGWPVAGLVLDGQPIPGTLRLPSSLLTPGEHHLAFLRAEPKDVAPVLAHTNFELIGIQSTDKGRTLKLAGYGEGFLRFTGAIDPAKVRVSDAQGKPLAFRHWTAEGGDRVQFAAAGALTVDLTQ